MNIKEDNYKKILSEIAEERGLFELASYIKQYGSPNKDLSKELGATVYPYNVPIREGVVSVTAEQSKADKMEAVKMKYNITKMPEATCDGCQ